MNTGTKYDIKKARPELYAPPKKDFVSVVVPPIDYLAIDGTGNPNTSADYTAAIEALYGLSYTLKFASKIRLGRDYAVGPLEGLWRSDNPGDFVSGNKDTWNWTMLVSLPEWITDDHIQDARQTLVAKKNPAALPRVHRLHLDEGLSLQITHVGSYDDEAPTLARLHDEYMPEHGYTFNGDHHEIYLSDPRGTAPAKLKTVLRQPVRPVEATPA